MNMTDKSEQNRPNSVIFFSAILILVCLKKCPFRFYCFGSNACKIEKMWHFWLSLHKQRRYAQIMWILLWLRLKNIYINYKGLAKLGSYYYRRAYAHSMNGYIGWTNLKAYIDSKECKIQHDFTHSYEFYFGTI